MSCGSNDWRVDERPGEQRNSGVVEMSIFCIPFVAHHAQGRSDLTKKIRTLEILDFQTSFC